MLQSLLEWFDTSRFPARWYCGEWSASLGYLHILSDVATWGAYTAIPFVLVYFVLKRRDAPLPRGFRKIFLLFGAFIFACGTVHLLEAVIFYYPVYPLQGLVKLATALVSWTTVVALVYLMPTALRFPGLARINAELAREIDERRAVEDQLRIAKVGAEDANRAKSQFLANMSHELRTPLNAIIGYSEMMAEDAEAEGQETALQDLQRIQKAGQHLLALINDVLDLAKIEAGKLNLYVERFELRPVIEEVCLTMTAMAEQHNNRLRCAFGDLGEIETDQTRLRQCLLNLVSNACKFTEDGEIRVEARREQHESGDWCYISVADTGIGIERSQINRLFQAFTQAEGDLTRRHGGTGLGLAITKTFCKLMGGDVQVESELGKGSTFTIAIPAKQPPPAIELPEEIGQQAARVLREKVRVEQGEETASRGLVLIIDDEGSARDLLQRFASRHGFRTASATCGREGIELARSLQPDLITLDVIMPDIDGWQVLSTLKADPVLRPIPVVLVSVLNEKQIGFALGAVDYVLKPLNKSSLNRVIERFEQRRNYGPVLIVDDDEAVRDRLEHIFTEAGWRVAEAENGRQALQAAEAETPSLVMLDLMMPVMDGFQFIEAFRAKPKFEEVPIVVLSSLDLSAEDLARLNGHAEVVLAKHRTSSTELVQLLQRTARSATVAHTA